MTAYWVVIAAATVTTLTAAAVGAALAVFAGQALPLAVRHDLSVAPGTALSAAGSVSNHQAAAAGDDLRAMISRALGGVPFTFWSASWSDPLGLMPGALPARPDSTTKGNTPLLEAAAMSGITSHAVLVSGQWPSAPATAGMPATAGIPAALPVTAATLLHVSRGDLLTLRDRASNSVARFRITGLFAPRQLSGTAASYWALNTVSASGSSTLGGFTTYGPLLVSPAAFTPAATSPLTVSTGSWVARPDMGMFTDADLSAISGDVSALPDALQNSASLSGMQLSTSLPSVLNAAASNLSVARSLLVISALQLLVLTVAALLAVARLLAAQRAGETALLIARGATRWQLTRLTAGEVIPLCGAAAVAGGLIGIRLATLLATAAPLRAAGTWLNALGAAVAIAVIAVAAMLAPGASAGQGAGEVRVRRGRQAAIASATRAGADLALIALAALAGWQLRRYSAASGGNAAVDPVLALAPALALAGCTVLTLRLLPAAARAGDRLAARGRRLTMSLAGWQVSRQPLRQGGAALLLVMAVATGTLALAQHASWTRSASDQANATAGADVRIDTPAALPPGTVGTITNASGVTRAMAVSVQQQALPAELLAIDPAQAPGIVRLRGDQTALPLTALFGKLMPGKVPGTPIPGRPDAIRLTASLGPASLAARLAPVTVTVTVADNTGNCFQVYAGTLPADGRPHLLTAPLGGTHADFPLRLIQVGLGYTLPAASAGPATLTVTAPPGVRLAGWAPEVTSAELKSLQGTGATMGSSSLPGTGQWRTADESAALRFSPGYGQAAANPGSSSPGPAEPAYGQVALNANPPDQLTAIPAIATKGFLDSSNVSVGSVVQATVAGVQVPLRIAAATSSFPTLGNGNALIADLSTIQNLLISQNAPPLPVTEWWLATSGHQVPPGLTAALPPGSAVTGTAQVAAALTGDPLSAAPQQALLALVVAAALLAITGFWVAIAADVRQRRTEHALLAALGVGQRSAALRLCLEKLLLSIPSAVLGAAGGELIAKLLVPAVTLTATAREPVPPPVTLLDLPQTVLLAAIVAVLPALAAALVMIRRPDPAAELRAAEAA
jgi:ABC-type antimicrobial peptide transport system permease subunit